MTRERLKSRRVEAGRHSIAIHELGEGVPVVLVHGLMGSKETWLEVADRLVASGYRAVIPELVGFGQSAREEDIANLWLDSQARALEIALGPSIPEGAVFAGHDYGGPTVVTLYRRAPRLVRGLLLMSCNLTTDTPIPFPLNSWSWPVVGDLMRKAVLSRTSMAMTARLAVDQPVALPLDAYLGDNRQFAAIQTIFKHAIGGLRERYRDVHETLPTIDVPTVVLWGDADPFFPLGEGRRMAALIPGARFGVLAECGHFAPEERPAEVAAGILRLVQSIYGGVGSTVPVQR